MPATDASVFTWLDDWWRSGGGYKVNGKQVSWASHNGRTAVSEKNAAPVGDGRFDLVITYSAPVKVPLSVYYSRFRGPDGAGIIDNTPTTHFYLPPAETTTTSTLELPLVPTEGAASWRPVLIEGAAGFVIEDVSIVPRPVNDLVRSWSGLEAVGGTGRDGRLRAWVRPGDVAVLFMASQWERTPCRPPAGWQTPYTQPITTGRSGYVATKTVAGEGWQHLEVDPWGGASNGARDRALLVILRDADDVAAMGWHDAPPAELKGRAWVLASQLHAVRGSSDTQWAMPGDSVVMQAGAHDPGGAWSVLRAVAGTGVPQVPAGATAPQGWAGVTVLPRVVPPRVSVWTGGEEVTARARRMPGGPASVDALLAKRGFVVAHRAGSLSWPEYSMQGFTQCVAHGVDALEVSCHRTSDGVWVASHDETLRRVDPSAPDTRIDQMTWEQAQAYHTKGQPLCRLEQIQEAYGGSHVLVVDPKGTAEHQAECLARFKPENTIVKASANLTRALSAAQQAGFRTWGFGLAAHVMDGRLEQWATACDFLGMEVNASSEAWAKTLALGKPVWAHLCLSKADYEQGLAAGAVGCVVASVSAVLDRKV